jgi:hypothetical protein
VTRRRPSVRPPARCVTIVHQTQQANKQTSKHVFSSRNNGTHQQQGTTENSHFSHTLSTVLSRASIISRLKAAAGVMCATLRDLGGGGLGSNVHVKCKPAAAGKTWGKTHMLEFVVYISNKQQIKWEGWDMNNNLFIFFLFSSIL